LRPTWEQADLVEADLKRVATATATTAANAIDVARTLD